MLKLKQEGDKLALIGANNACLVFELSDKKIQDVIVKNINVLDRNGCNVYVERKVGKITYLVLNSYKILVPMIIANEISSRMILLNKTLKFPKRL